MRIIPSRTSMRGKCWRILTARVLDKTELEAEEQDFWAEVVQRSGEYSGKFPVNRWLTKIAKCQAIDGQRRQVRRQERVLFRAEMAAKT